jgi:hypothetical protein
MLMFWFCMYIQYTYIFGPQSQIGLVHVTNETPSYCNGKLNDQKEMNYENDIA